MQMEAGIVSRASLYCFKECVLDKFHTSKTVMVKVSFHLSSGFRHLLANVLFSLRFQETSFTAEGDRNWRNFSTSTRISSEKNKDIILRHRDLSVAR